MNEQTALRLIGLFPIMLLIVLLVIKELGRAYGWPQSSVWSRVLNFVIAALIPLVVVVLVMRFLYVVGPR